MRRSSGGMRCRNGSVRCEGLVMLIGGVIWSVIGEGDREVGKRGERKYRAMSCIVFTGSQEGRWLRMKMGVGLPEKGQEEVVRALIMVWVF